MRYERMLRAALLVATLSATESFVAADTPAPSGAPTVPASDGPVAPVTRVPEAVQLAPTESAERAPARAASSTPAPLEGIPSGRALGFSAGALVLVVALLVTLL